MNKPERFGPFKLDKMIGRGGMGAVYRATREDDGRVVAVKALLAPFEDEPERERFEAEISTLKLLRCENIVKLHGFGQEDGTLYYAMEYVDGPSLATLVKRGRRFDWEEVAYIGVAVCKALKHAHDRGVVHRDVKPANILLLNDGVVKVSDYGIAQYFGASRLTGVNQVVGTIEYMAPEQAQAGPLTPRTDLYALGATMYSLLVGTPPYVAKSLAELLRKHRETTPAPIRATRPEVPKAFDECVLDLLQISPEKRSGDARLVGRRLESVLKANSNFPEDNPFLNWRFTIDGRWFGPGSADAPLPVFAERSERGETDSRVDLANPSVVVDASFGEAGGEKVDADDETRPERTLDLPYRPFDDASAASNADVRAPNFGDDSNDASDFSLFGETRLGESGNAPTLAALETDVSSETPSAENSRPTVRPNEASTVVVRPSRDSREAATLAASAPERGDSFAESAKPAEQPPKPEPAPLSETLPLADAAENESASNDDFAVDADSDSSEFDNVKATPVEKFKRSLFTPVDEGELGALPEREEKRPYRFVPIVGAAIVFIALGIVFWRSFQTPTADELYARVDERLKKVEGNEERFLAELRRNERRMLRFLELYPTDVRANEIGGYLNELELDSLETRLERRIRSNEKDSGAPATERLYFEARRVAETDPEEGVEKLTAFVELFDSPEEPSDVETETDSAEEPSATETETDSARETERRLVELARRRLERLVQERDRIRRADSELLNERLAEALAIRETDPERSAKMRRALAELYGERDWAREILERADESNPRPNEKAE